MPDVVLSSWKPDVGEETLERTCIRVIKEEESTSSCEYVVPAPKAPPAVKLRF